MVQNIKVNGKMENRMEEGVKSFLMVSNMEANGRMVKNVDK